MDQTSKNNEANNCYHEEFSYDIFTSINSYLD